VREDTPGVQDTSDPKRVRQGKGSKGIRDRHGQKSEEGKKDTEAGVGASTVGVFAVSYI